MRKPKQTPGIEHLNSFSNTKNDYFSVARNVTFQEAKDFCPSPGFFDLIDVIKIFDYFQCLDLVGNLTKSCKAKLKRWICLTLKIAKRYKGSFAHLSNYLF